MRARIGVTVCFLLFGCQGEEGAPCMTGWWQDPTAGTCVCPGAAECDASDCEARRIVGFTMDGQSYTGIARISESLGTLTPVGSLSAGTYRVGGGEVLVTPSDAPAYSASMSCSGHGLVINGVSKVRASGWIASELTAISADVASQEVSP
jgi:hypothetical protein